MITIKIQDSEVRAALDALARRLTNLQPALQAVGEDIVTRAKARFGTSTAPDGQRWAPNARSTIEAFIAQRGGFGKKGINKEGQGLARGKKPLIGESGDLRRKFHAHADAQSLTVAHGAIYAAIQQFGGQKSAYPHLWGDIPARPFLPIQQNGDLYPAERVLILDAINDYLAGQ